MGRRWITLCVILCFMFVVFLPMAAQAQLSHKGWDKRCVAEFKRQGVSKANIKRLMYIHHHESNNPYNRGRTYWGAFQLKKTMCKGKPWKSPEWTARRVLKYVKHHRYAGYGRGIKAAYRHKRSRGWY